MKRRKYRRLPEVRAARRKYDHSIRGIEVNRASQAKYKRTAKGWETDHR
jgi:hypothetical protein